MVGTVEHERVESRRKASHLSKIGCVGDVGSAQMYLLLLIFRCLIAFLASSDFFFSSSRAQTFELCFDVVGRGGEEGKNLLRQC